MNSTLENGLTVKLGLPWHGWLLSGIFFFYSLAAAYDHVMSLSQGEVYYRACGMSESQIIYFSSIPVWVVIGWTFSGWGGLFGSLALFFRHSFSAVLLFTSLAGSLIYALYSYFLSSGRDAMGALWPMPIIIAVITAALIVYCHRLTKLNILK